MKRNDFLTGNFCGWLLICLLICAFASGGIYLAFSADSMKEIYFFCGSAVRMPMDEIIKNFEAEGKIKVNVIYGGSGNLLSQMEMSRKGDVYLAGSPDYIAIGEQKNLFVQKSAKKVSYLIPAIIVPKGNPAKIFSLADLAKPDIRIGMGDPETVCLGLYGIEILEYNGLMKKVLPNVVNFAKSCEDTATLVVLKQVDAILGWDVFANWNPNDVEWIKIADNDIPRIAYTAIAMPVFVTSPREATNFMDYVLSEKGKQIFEKWGYMNSEKQAKKYAAKAKIGGEYKLPFQYFELLKK
jgi:molybdate transport system substrate-binding protein